MHLAQRTESVCFDLGGGSASVHRKQSKPLRECLFTSWGDGAAAEGGSSAGKSESETIRRQTPDAMQGGNLQGGRHTVELIGAHGHAGAVPDMGGLELGQQEDDASDDDNNNDEASDEGQDRTKPKTAPKTNAGWCEERESRVRRK